MEDAKIIKKIEERVRDFVERHGLMHPDKRYLVALSGGADSVSLMLILSRLGYHVEAVHCNFNLRRGEAERDEQFCVSLCERKQIPLHRVHFETRQYAALHHISVEMAARDLRYSYFAQLMKDIHADGICVGHHRDDSVETLLMNLIRGTGLQGLRGIAPLNGDIIRPLLCISRSEIEEYLHALGEAFVTDSSNLVANVVRNKIRLEVLPTMQRINPSVGESISKTAVRISEAFKVFESAMTVSVKEVLGGEHIDKRGCVIPVSRLQAQVSPEYTLFYILRNYHFNSAQVEDIYRNITTDSGAVFHSSTHQLLVDRNQLIVEPIVKEEQQTTFRIPEEGTYVIGDGQRVKVERLSVDDHFLISKERRCVNMDASAVQFPLMLRKVQTGDRFRPFGMKGSQLVSDYMTNRKFSLFEKSRQWVLTDHDNHILWLVNERPDDRFKVTPATKEVIRVTYLEQV